MGFLLLASFLRSLRRAVSRSWRVFLGAHGRVADHHSAVLVGQGQHAGAVRILQGLIPVLIEDSGLDGPGQGFEFGADDVLQAGVFQGT